MRGTVLIQFPYYLISSEGENVSKHVDYKEYVKWWNYWNSKLPQKPIFAGHLTSEHSYASADSRGYRERVQRSLFFVHKLQQNRNDWGRPIERSNLQDAESNTEQWEGRLEGWED